VTHTYADGVISPTITVDLVDEDGTHTNAGSRNLTVANVAPTIALSGDSSVNEGAVFSLTLGAVTDPGDDAVSQYTVHWGDTLSDTFTSAGIVTHTYADGVISPTITVDLVDEDGTHTNAGSRNLTVANVAPTIALSGDSSVNEGAVFSLTLGAVTDPGDDAVSQYTVHWGDTLSDTFTAAGIVTHTYADDNTLLSITVDLVDEDSTHTDAGSRNLTVDNVAPTIALSGDSNVDEGAVFSLPLGAVTDPGDDTVTEYTVHWGDAASDTFTTTGVVTHTYGDGVISPTITVDLVDEDGTHTNAGSHNLTVDNVAPTVDAGSDQTVDEGDSVNFYGSFIDPGDDTHDIVWDFGDGTFAAGILTPTRTYSEPLSLVVTLTITDDDGGVGSDVMTVTVKNLAPNANAGGPYTGTAGMPVTMTASASWDPGGGPLTYAWDLDEDGFYDNASGEIVTYTWTEAGAHAPTVQVADAQLAVDTDSASVSIAPAELHHIVLSPPAATILARETQTYTVEAFDVYSNSRGDVTNQATFDIVENGHGGYWTDNVYIPYTHGDWTVRAVYTGTRVTTDTASLTVLAPDLHLVKSDSPDPVEAGDFLTYTLTYSNTGNLTATGVVISDVLGIHVSYVTASLTPTGGLPDEAYWITGDLAPDERGQILLTVAVARPLPNDTVLTNTTWLDADWLGVDQTTPLSATQQTTVHSRPVLTITKTGEPDPVITGQILNYTLVITNSGNENASSVTVVEDYDPNTSFIYSSPAPDPGSGNREWSFETLPVDASETIDIIVQVSSPLTTGTILTNNVTLNSNQTPPLTTTEVTSVTSASNLIVSKIDYPDPVPAGENLVYVIAYENSGNAPAPQVVLTETYDTRVEFVSASPTPEPGTNNVWYIGNLDVNEGGNIMLTVRVDTPLTNGTVLTNYATIDSENTSPRTFTETTTVASATDLSFSITVQPDPVEAGDSLSYTLNYTNTGNASATQVVVSATFDSFAPFSSATPAPTGGMGDVRYWEIGVITGVNNYGVNSVGEIVIQTDVTLPLTNGTPLSFTTQLEDAEGDFLENAAYATVTSAPILFIDKNDDVSTVYAGDVLTYTLTYTNSGNENGCDIVITDTLPANYTQYISCEIAGGTCQHLPANNEVIFHIPALIAPTSSQAQLVLQVDDPLPAGADLVTNRVTMTHSSLSAPIDVQDVNLIGTLPDLTVDATNNPSLFSPGKLMTYTVTYSNTGHMHAKDVSIVTTLPPSAAYEGYGWASSDGQTYTYPVDNLLAGDTGNTIKFTVKYPDSEPQQINATEFDTSFTIAETGSAGGDANPGDNSTNVYIGVPDLVVISFTIEPQKPNVPVTFTVQIANYGTGRAENPASGGGSTLDIFTSPVESYPWERYGPIWDYIPPIAPGDNYTHIVTVNNPFDQEKIQFSEQELREAEFYVRVDSHADHPYGLVPESDEMNNIGKSPSPSPDNYDIYLPLVQRNRGQ